MINLVSKNQELNDIIDDTYPSQVCVDASLDITIQLYFGEC